jgi:GTP cyclohydrolase I
MEVGKLKRHGAAEEEMISRIISFVGDDPNRDGLKETPARVVRSWVELYSGYTAEQDLPVLMKTFDAGPCNEMVVVRDIEFWSTCEHHMLPFVGVAHVGYLPDGRVIGLSKIPRLVEVFSRRLQVQERLTVQITDALTSHLRPKGAACVLEAKHLCMSCRGVRQGSASMVTSSLVGAFKVDERTRSEFLSLVRSK